MRAEHAPNVAAQIRASVPTGADVAADVAEIVAAVRTRGDEALHEYEAKFAGEETHGFALGPPLKLPAAALDIALESLDDAVRAGLEVAIANVRAVAEAGLDDDRLVTLPEGQTVKLREIPVRRAAIYAPSGRHPYPSTVVMGAITAQAAGVDEVVVATAPHPVLLAAARLCEVDAVYRITGAQAIAALAYGTESVPRVDVIVGPGSLWVQEAKRQVSGVVGIDGFAGPSDLTVIATKGADVEALKLDLAAQAEHGEGSLTVAIRDDAEIIEALAGAGNRVLADDSRPRSRWPRRWRRSTCSSRGRPPRRSPRASAAPAACSSATRPARRSVTTSPAPTTRSRPRAPPASPPASTCATSGAGWPRCASTTPRPRSRPPACRSPRPRASPRTPPRCRCVRIDDRDPHRPAQPQDRRDRRRA